MPRRSRIHLDGVPLHIVQRGHNREPCFFAEDDYSSYLHWLSEALTESGCIIRAWLLLMLLLMLSNGFARPHHPAGQ